MKKIWEIIGGTLSKYNLAESALSLAIIWRFHKHISDMFWNKILNYVKATKFQNNTIFVESNSSSWSQEIQLSRNDIIDMLKRDFPEKLTFGIKIITKQDDL